MAYYTFLDANNVVTEVIVGVPETELIEGLDPETWYGNFRGQTCKRTSYNTTGGVHNEGGTPFRKNFAGIEYTYDPARDAFIPPQPDGDYYLDEETCLWRAPEIGIVDDAPPIITADGVDFVMVYLIGQPNSTQGVFLNGEPLEVLTNADGYAEFELATDTPGLIMVEWGGFSLEVAAL